MAGFKRYYAMKWLKRVLSIILNGKRLHELIMLQILLERQIIDKDIFTTRLLEEGGTFREQDYLSAVRVLEKDFLNTQSEKTKYLSVEFFVSEKIEEFRFLSIKRLLASPSSRKCKVSFNMELKNTRTVIWNMMRTI